MLKLISTGNQLSPDMINADGFPDWGPNVSKVDAPLKVLRQAIPMPTLNTTATAWEATQSGLEERSRAFAARPHPMPRRFASR